MRPFTLCFLCLALLGAAHADLRFEATTIERSAKVGDRSVVGEFKFTNEGRSQVRIKTIDSNCGCLRAESDKRVYKPGESGVIEAEFIVKGLTGTVEKSISVYTRSHNFPTRLAVRVTIPDILSIEPKMTKWSLGSNPVPKRVVFKVLRPEPIRIREAVPSRKSITAKLHTIEEGRHYEIELTPKDTSSIMLGVVRIETDCEIREQRRQMAFFNVAREDD